MRRVIRRAGLPCLASLVLTGGLPATVAAQEVTVSAAISLKEVAEEVGRRFQQARPGVVLRYNFGSSGELQKQIEAGAPVDVFLSAGQTQMDELEAKGLIVKATRRLFARNALVVIVPTDTRVDMRQPEDLRRSKIQRIVIGNPKTVPAGQYAEESLKALGLWEAVRPSLIFAENVRQVLEYVARGEVDAGFVYATDVAAGRDRVREAFRPPPDSHRPIAYPAAVVTGSRVHALGQAFIEWLLSSQGETVLRRFGFQPPSGSLR